MLRATRRRLLFRTRPLTWPVTKKLNSYRLDITWLILVFELTPNRFVRSDAPFLCQNSILSLSSLSDTHLALDSRLEASKDVFVFNAASNSLLLAQLERYSRQGQSSYCTAFWMELGGLFFRSQLLSTLTLCIISIQDSVARECPIMAQAGYGYAQVSPPQEHITGTQWYTEWVLNLPSSGQSLGSHALLQYNR